MILFNLPYQAHPACFLRVSDGCNFPGGLIHWGNTGVWLVPSETENIRLSQREDIVNTGVADEIDIQTGVQKSHHFEDKRRKGFQTDARGALGDLKCVEMCELCIPPALCF